MSEPIDPIDAPPIVNTPAEAIADRILEIENAEAVAGTDEERTRTRSEITSMDRVFIMDDVAREELPVLDTAEATDALAAHPEVEILLLEYVAMSYGGAPLKKGVATSVPCLDAIALAMTYPQLIELVDPDHAVAVVKAHRARIREAEEAAQKDSAAARDTDAQRAREVAEDRAIKALELAKALEE